MSLLPVGFGASGDDYTIDDSLRFRLTGALYRTFGTPTDNNKWTYSVWFKRGNLDNVNTLFGRYLGGTNFIRADFISKSFRLFQYLGSTPYSILVTTAAVFRDPSAWYHLTIAIDTSNATAADRVIYYINGVRVTAFSSAIYPGVNVATNWNVSGGVVHRIGALTTGDTDGYMTEINFIDGQALTADDFGEFDDNGTWKPLAYTGTYGNNGFYIDATTSGTAVLDQSGNSNNWSSTNMNFTTSTATTYDLMKDTPSLVDENAGNFATWNPIDIPDPSANSYSRIFSEANLTVAKNGSEGVVNMTTVASFEIPTSGKWYWEIAATTVASASASRTQIGIMNQAAKFADGADHIYADVAGTYAYAGSGHKVASPGTFAAYGASYTSGVVIGVAVDADNGTIAFYKNGAAQGTAYSGLDMSTGFSPSVGYWGTFTANFGQRPFAYTPPSGFLKLNTFNLPDSTIEKGSDYFNTVLYNGAGGAQSITGVGFQSDFTWIKSRTAAYTHGLFDANRGVQKLLQSNSAAAEITSSAYVTSFNSDGFSIGGTQFLNGSGDTFVSWNWKANGSGVTNNAGTNGATLASTYSANPTAGFSIVTYTGNQVAGATVYHGLGTAPSMIIVKGRSNSTSGWAVGHQSLGWGSWLTLQTTNAVASGADLWNNTAPSANLVTLGISGIANLNNQTAVAYCFAEVPGYSAIGSYTGNGSADGAFVHLGFRPRFVIFKRTDSVSQWAIIDTERSPYNQTQRWLYPNLSAAEDDASVLAIDFLSNGFKIRSPNVEVNASGGTQIYMAFAESPFKNSNAR